MKPSNTQIIFETKRLRLRQFRTTDLDDYWALTRQVKDNPTVAWPVYQTMTEAAHGLAKEARSLYHFAIVLKDKNKVVGAIKLDRYKKEPRSTIKTAPRTKEINYLLNPRYWRQGIIPEAMQAVVQYAFEILNVPEIVACHAEINVPSGKVQERLGFNIAGRIVNYYTWTDGTLTARIQRKLTQAEFFHQKQRTAVKPL